MSLIPLVLDILQHSTLILPVNRREGGGAVEAVAVADCCGREQEALYYYSNTG